MSKPLTIGQVATSAGVSAHTLRYYERAGLLQSIGRADSGHRLYSPADLDWLQFVMRLKATGMPLATIKTFADLRAQGAPTYDARRAMLADHREAVKARIAEAQANLTAIEAKMVWYEDASSDGHRHDTPLPPHRKEKDPSWTSQSTPTTPAPRTTASKRPAIDTVRAGKS